MSIKAEKKIDHKLDLIIRISAVGRAVRASGVKKQLMYSAMTMKHMKAMKISILHAFHVLHGLTIKRTHTYS
jgi:hypothetical protein